jgi:flagellar biosynthesis protein FlhB
LADEDKQFEASAHKLRKAREQGQVVKSRDLSSGVFMLAMFMLLFKMGPFIWHESATMFIQILEQIPYKHLEDMDPQYMLLVTIKAVFLMVAPFMFIAALVAAACDFAQVGFLVATKAIEPNFGKLNPVKGFQNIFSQRTVIELVKNLLKIFVMGYFAWITFQKYFGHFLALGATENIFSILGLLAQVLFEFIMNAGFVFLVIGMADFLYQRIKFMNDQKMSFKEMKDEYKSTEGDPMVKHALRQRRMQMLQQSMLEAVPTADVVTTNPIHIAVALKYNADVMEAPRVVAKGTELFAEEIKRIATENGVPIVENPMVARALFRLVDIDQEIPPDLYQAVAEILMFAWRIKGIIPPGR